MSKTETEILELLSTQPRDAIIAIIENYTGLSWRIAEKYLSDPEDIKECVNDSFLEFYNHRLSFDRTKGSIAIFLGTITRNLAITRYRKLKSHPGTPLSRDIADEKNFVRQLEDRIDLEQAIASLDPKDAQIIRMKYYNGMTIQEIADSMHLPYETVKKRHQRSLNRIRWLLMILITIALVAALSACAYWAMRYLGLIPGYGVSLINDTPVYVLNDVVEKNCTITDNDLSNPRSLDNSSFYDVKYTIEEAYLIEGNIIMLVELEAQNPIAHAFPAMDLQWEGQELECLGMVSNAIDEEHTYFRYHFSASSLMEIEQEEILLTAILPMEKENDKEETPIILRKHNPKELTGSTTWETTAWGALIAMPRLEEGHLIIGIQPLNLSGYILSPYLLTDQYRQGRAGDITVTDSNGLTLTGEMQTDRVLGSLTYFDWDFGAASPGNYTLHVPYIYLDIPCEEYVFTIDLTEETRQPQNISVPGGTLSLTGCQHIGENHTSDFVSDDWKVTFDYEKKSDLDLFRIYLSFQFLDKNGEIIKEADQSFSFFDDDFVPGTLDFVLHIPLGEYDRSNCQIILYRSLSYRWEHEFNLPVTVK